MSNAPQTRASNTRFHLFYAEQWGERQLIRLTTDAQDALRYAQEYMCNVTSDSNAALLALSAQPWHKVMDDASWQALAPQVGRYQQMVGSFAVDDQKEPYYPTTPIDLPPKVAEKRDQLLRAIGNDEDLTTRCELTEILMAAKARRPVNQEVFRVDSLEGPTWADQIESQSIQRVEYDLDAVITRLADPASQDVSAIERLKLIAEREELECQFYDLAEDEPGAMLAFG
ncbi:MAG: hypothetical protein AWU57_314 [Marinobacter sp. T13-3]|nr:MAG: hypothetical protein AWU57_314 [Marinobacter sp. T13-3]